MQYDFGGHVEFVSFLLVATDITSALQGSHPRPTTIDAVHTGRHEPLQLPARADHEMTTVQGDVDNLLER